MSMAEETLLDEVRDEIPLGLGSCSGVLLSQG